MGCQSKIKTVPDLLPGSPSMLFLSTSSRSKALANPGWRPRARCSGLNMEARLWPSIKMFGSTANSGPPAGFLYSSKFLNAMKKVKNVTKRVFFNRIKRKMKREKNVKEIP